MTHRVERHKNHVSKEVFLIAEIREHGVTLNDDLPQDLVQFNHYWVALVVVRVLDLIFKSKVESFTDEFLGCSRHLSEKLSVCFDPLAQENGENLKHSF